MEEDNVTARRVSFGIAKLFAELIVGQFAIRIGLNFLQKGQSRPQRPSGRLGLRKGPSSMPAQGSRTIGVCKDLGTLERSTGEVQLRATAAIGEGSGDGGVDVVRSEGLSVGHGRRGARSAAVARGRRGSASSEGVGESSVLELKLLKLQGEGLALMVDVGGDGRGLRGDRSLPRGRWARGRGGWCTGGERPEGGRGELAMSWSRRPESRM